MSQPDKQYLLQLLADNQLDQIFAELKSRQFHLHDALLLESQWNDLKSKLRNGTISADQSGLETARIRKHLLDLIEARPSISFGASTQAGSHLKNRWLIITGIGVGLIALVLIFTQILSPGTDQTPSNDSSLSHKPNSKPSPVSVGKLDISGASPITFAAGDFQYERVYSIVKTSVESTGGGKSLITLTVGLNFKGIINDILSTDNFRLVADELKGPLAPANFLNKLVDSKSYEEGDIKFEISDEIKRFYIIVEGKEDKKWTISR